MNNADIKSKLKEFVKIHGPWTTNIFLPGGEPTVAGCKGLNTRVHRILQLATDLSPEPLSSLKILDLGCLEGKYSIEFALQGADVTGVEIREANLKKAEFSREIFGLNNLKFIQDDVRNVTRDKYGKFDIINFSGLFYHLDSPDIFHVIKNLYEIVQGFMVIDTHISLSPASSVQYKGVDYHGHMYREHFPDESDELKKERNLSSYGNDTSFWLTRPSFINLLSNIGFSSTFECFTPVHLQPVKSDGYRRDRCTFVALKGKKLSPKICIKDFRFDNQLPEGSLSYPLSNGGKSDR